MLPSLCLLSWLTLCCLNLKCIFWSSSASMHQQHLLCFPSMHSSIFQSLLSLSFTTAATVKKNQKSTLMKCPLPTTLLLLPHCLPFLPRCVRVRNIITITIITMSCFVISSALPLFLLLPMLLVLARSMSPCVHAVFIAISVEQLLTPLLPKTDTFIRSQNF